MTDVKFCTGVHCNKGHDSILQLLDRPVGDLYFGKEVFQPTVTSWNGLPIVFADTHPDPIRFNGDALDEELKRVNGVIVGELSDARIDMAGHPKLMARQNFSIDVAEQLYRAGKISKATFDRTRSALAQLNQLLNEGKLSLSTGFLCPDDGSRLTGTVQPNHVLCFVENAQSMPRDKGAVFLNKAPDDPLDHHIPGRPVSFARCPTCGHVVEPQTPGEREVPGRRSFRSGGSRSP